MKKQFCERYCGRFATYLVQEVGEKRTLDHNDGEKKLLPPYASQIELVVMIFFRVFAACFLSKQE